MAADKKGKPLLECTEIPLSERLDGPDKYSPLNGVDLVRNKVKELHMMGCCSELLDVKYNGPCRHFSLSYLPVSVDKPLVGCKFFQAHGAAGSQLLGAYADFCAEPELSSV